MEFLIGLLALVTVVVLLVLVATGGHPLRLVRSLGQAWRTLKLNRGPLGWSLLCVALVGVFLWLFYATPGSRIGAAQPIPFSHRLHAGVKNIDCAYCHPYVDRSLHPGLPPVDKCLHCHRYIIANHPEIQKEHQYFNSGTPTPWVKVNVLAEHVLFNHERHIKREFQCKECHGAIETMDRIRGENFKMGFCITCHRKHNANVGCWLACHM